MSEHMYIAWCPYMEDIRMKHSENIDIRVGLFIASMDQETFV